MTSATAVASQFNSSSAPPPPTRMHGVGGGAHTYSHFFRERGYFGGVVSGVIASGGQYPSSCIGVHVCLCPEMKGRGGGWRLGDGKRGIGTPNSMEVGTF